MSESTHFQNSPLRVTIEADQKFAYCTCGHSDHFPKCDGAHKTYGGKPIKFTLDRDKVLSLCRCGRSKTIPYCDATHSVNS